MGAHTATHHVVEVLGRVPFFRALPRSDLERMAALVRPRELAEAEFLYREGDAGDRLFVIASGAVEILKERPLGDHERLAVRRSGEAFGELSLLDDAPRSTSVRGIEATQLLSISRDDFDALLGGDSLSVRLMRSLARALRAADFRSSAPERAIAADGLRQFGRMVLNGLEPAAPPQAPGLLIAGGNARDAEGTGGSLWDGFNTEDGRAMVALLDVKGTGLPPAYLIAVTRALLREVAPDVSFDRLVSRLNSGTFRNLFEGLDECVEAAVVEAADGAVRWSSAGDQTGVVLRADGGVKRTPGHGPPLGILPHFDYATTPVDLASGDTLLAFSDAPAGLVNGAIELACGRADASPAELVRLLGTAMLKLEGRGRQTDVSFVAIRKL